MAREGVEGRQEERLDAVAVGGGEHGEGRAGVGFEGDEEGEEVLGGGCGGGGRRILVSREVLG